MLRCSLCCSQTISWTSPPSYFLTASLGAGEETHHGGPSCPGSSQPLECGRPHLHTVPKSLSCCRMVLAQDSSALSQGMFHRALLSPRATPRLWAICNDLTKSKLSSTPSHLPASCPSQNFIFLQNSWRLLIPALLLQLLNLCLEFFLSIFCLHWLSRWLTPFSRLGSGITFSKESFLKISTPSLLWQVCGVCACTSPLPCGCLWWQRLCHGSVPYPPDSKGHAPMPGFSFICIRSGAWPKRHLMGVWTKPYSFML